MPGTTPLHRAGQLILVIVSSVIATPTAAAADVPPPTTPAGQPEAVSVLEPYPLPLQAWSCGELLYREVAGWETNKVRKHPANLNRPRKTFYRAGRQFNPFDVSWSDWIEAAEVALFWVMDSSGSTGSGKSKLDGGLQGREKLNIVVPGQDGLAGEVLIENDLSVAVARIDVTNLDWPGLDTKILSADARIWMRDVAGTQYGRIGQHTLAVPTQVSLGASGQFGLEYVDASSPRPTIGFQSVGAMSGSGGHGFLLNLWFPVPVSPVSLTHTWAPGATFDQWYQLESFAEAHLSLEEKDFFYDGSVMQLGIRLLNRFERVRIQCWFVGGGGGGGAPPREEEQKFGARLRDGGKTKEPPMDERASLDVASGQEPVPGETGLRLELPRSLGAGEFVMGSLRNVGDGAEPTSVLVCAEPGGIVELENDEVALVDGRPGLVTVRALAPGAFVLRFTDASGRLPSLEHHGEVRPADPTRIGLSFSTTENQVGELVSLGVALTAPAEEPVEVCVTSANPLVCRVDGDGRARRFIGKGEREVYFALHVQGVGVAELEAVVPARGARAVARLTGLPAGGTGLTLDVSDGEIVSADRQLCFTASKDAPRGVLLTWSLRGDPAATLAGTSFGTHRTGPLRAGDRIDLPFQIGKGQGVELRLRWVGEMHGERSVFLYGSHAGTRHLLDDLIRDLASFEGGVGGTLSAKARLARLDLARGDQPRAGARLAHLLQSLDHPAWGGATYPAADRKAMRAAVERVAAQLGLKLP